MTAISTIYGTQYEIMWSDYNCPKGFHIFDTETRELEKNRKSLKIFKKFMYDDTKYNYDHTSIHVYDGCFVKLFVSQKTNEEMYSKLIEDFTMK